ncbi:MAG: hypothetical protein DCC68_22515 [Planctomycetota bacterium]|nr:MAG: hypothetical protein DCC68_22515 [Planctomycetota bacterium]
MIAVKRPIGFATVDQCADFFGLTQREVKQKAQSGDWPSYFIGDRRVFDMDELVKLLARHSQEITGGASA